MKRQEVGIGWQTGRFLVDRPQSLEPDILHLFCPGGRDLPLEHLVALALLPIHDWNNELLEGAAAAPFPIGGNVSACVLAMDPFRRLRDLLQALRGRNFRWVTNFPSTEAVDGGMRATLDDFGFGLEKELTFVEEAAALGFGVAAFATTTSTAAAMVERGATALATPDASLIDTRRLPSTVPLIQIEMRRPA